MRATRRASAFAFTFVMNTSCHRSPLLRRAACATTLLGCSAALAQPWVVLDGGAAARSQALNVESFLRKRLPMNGSWDSQGQRAGGSRNNSQISLRGLGTHQTLVLVDGRRMPNLVSETRQLDQPDINAIPPGAIERIEVLPSSAGGIYGGGATGGVVNIILKRDYRGIQLDATAGDTFRGDYWHQRVDANAGFTSRDGKSSMALSASHLRTGDLRAGERAMRQDARDLLLRNAPDQLFDDELQMHGALPNIRSTDGAPLVLKPQYGGASLGHAATYLGPGYAGWDAASIASLRANAGANSTAFADDAYGNRENTIAAQRLTSVLFNARHQLGERLELFGDAILARNEGRGVQRIGPARVWLAADAPNNPFMQEVEVGHPYGQETPHHTRIDQYRASAGLIWRMSRAWTVSADYAQGRTSTRLWQGPNTSFDANRAFASGLALPNGLPAPDVFRPNAFAPYLEGGDRGYQPGFDATLEDINLRAAGKLFALPGGPASVSLLLEHRREELLDSTAYGINFNGADQRVRSAYGELVLPLVGKANARPWLRELELRGSLRYDDYRTRAPVQCCSPDPDLASNEAGALAYTVGLRYRPAPGVTLRASYGTGFLPARTDQVSGSRDRYDYPAGFFDPLRGGEAIGVAGDYTLVSGGDTGLREEESRSASVGVILEPTALPELRLSLDYTRIVKRDEISPLSATFVLANPGLLPGRVERAAPSADDIARGYTVGRVTLLDLRLSNLARSMTEALDVQLDYTWRTARHGAFRPYLVGTWQPTFERQTLPGSRTVNEAGYGELLRQGRTDGVFNKVRFNAGMAWEQGPLSVGVDLQFHSSYRITSPEAGFDGGRTNAETVRRQGSGRIASQTYVDLTMAYDFSEQHADGPLAGVVLSAGIENLFDRTPPLFAEAHREYYSTVGDPRLRRFQVGVRKAF